MDQEPTRQGGSEIILVSGQSPLGGFIQAELFSKAFMGRNAIYCSIGKGWSGDGVP